MQIRRIKFKKIKDFLKKLPKTLGERAFLTFLALLLIALILGGLIFYKYSISIDKEEPTISEKPPQFEEKTYQTVLKTWQEKEKRFEEADSKTYPDPFR
ncbi:MAG: hypothetical protein AUJ31_02175 [Parcubacteria group bacterium CG1_02_39_15]|uniref:Uncharacterized protein n=4 Tax=Candidatus Nealsoniibacteriota TaxID=1817911 RepID=A0A2G9YV60_9BACT|nr:MAG: hypothetical protein AUJ31_02175 [Parcubacteria group bacterium CG1_02_39_15]PIP22371.1 MAG: hypothetical protein COX38_01005 [Candidatus Nealsonbacteria bacterium CG23_combo_of_CG06-09_8_20_14_all_39_25]PIQ98567.1 MAG: hypothetical protein COV64_00465 [Candidatus Nealsonbacteria bacterium CG11_big_fil_rev_8_21_14_0_20_39_9]PIZ88191.1 MAG: hypothetical protein COX91_01490 [Candidatus Nealsonbacteria bacterium CG_4_10_14_0_2_um_filter_39_15]